MEKNSWLNVFPSIKLVEPVCDVLVRSCYERFFDFYTGQLFMDNDSLNMATFWIIANAISEGSRLKLKFFALKDEGIEIYSLRGK